LKNQKTQQKQTDTNETVTNRSTGQARGKDKQKIARTCHFAGKKKDVIERMEKTHT
jgi:hypothetical protein